ncbi:MAG: hypothetical protein KBS85_06620, partial [Lachnospiraceae bacterium]|nr:hypothetical protein [Candidatus Merdinaster equi]
MFNKNYNKEVKKNNTNIIREGSIYVVVTSVIFTLVFVVNRLIPFINDDIWYGTNLVTGERIASFSDILTSQVWHFYNWGGRCMTHGILQLVLACGELIADILNSIMLALLAYIICWMVGIYRRKVAPLALLSVCLLIVLNPAPHMNLFWQSGVVNYLYSTVWIFLFVGLYIKRLKINDSEGAITELAHVKDYHDNVIIIAIKAIGMLILGLISGWSNENMGPASMLMAIVILVICRRKNIQTQLWMYTGIVGAFVGSVIVIVAPGNFVRSSLIKESFLDAIVNHLGEMVRATFDYLFPVILISVLLTVIFVARYKRKLMLNQILLLLYAGLAHGAMVLSPTYPSRATFGVLAILIAYDISLVNSISECGKLGRKSINIALGVLGVMASLVLIRLIVV